MVACWLTPYMHSSPSSCLCTPTYIHTQKAIRHLGDLIPSPRSTLCLHLWIQFQRYHHQMAQGTQRWATGKSVSHSFIHWRKWVSIDSRLAYTFPTHHTTHQTYFSFLHHSLYLPTYLPTYTDPRRRASHRLWQRQTETPNRRSNPILGSYAQSCHGSSVWGPDLHQEIWSCRLYQRCLLL